MVMEEQPKVRRGAPANRPCVAAGAAAFKSSKKNTNKPKKIPQRGLGVAQLEKLRCLEGLQMNGGASASSAHGLGLPVEPRDASTFFIRPPTVHDLLAAASFSGQQQHRPPPPPPPPQPPAIFPTFWNADHPNNEPSFTKKTEHPPVPNSNSRLISLAQTIPMVNSVVDHRTEPPSNQNTPNIYDLRTSYWREQEKNLLEMLGNKRPWTSRLDGVPGHAAYHPHRHHLLSRDEGSSRGMANSLQKRSDDCSSANGTNSSKLEFQDVRANTSASFSDLATSDLCLETRNTENGSFLGLGLVSTPNLRSIDNSQYHYSDFNLQNPQKNSGNGSPPNRLPFYNFFPPGTFRNEKMPSENSEALVGDIDLDLKL